MTEKIFLRKLVDKGARTKQYFLRGHNAWFALGFSLMNFTLIFYNLLFKNLFFVPNSIKSYSIFFVLFAAFYIPIATIFGFFDFRKGTFAAEQLLSKEISPIWKELFSRLQSLEHGNRAVLAMLEELQNNKKT
ncbi:MAG: hypothetical protein ACXAC7_07120 [Candidatus Hodarchaeales archaeon]|jgi:hypothetical protein